MIEHHIQKEILHRLVTAPSAHFAELKPDDLDSNAFTYHLQQLIKQKYVAKQDDGTYALTPLGKAAGVNIALSAKAVLEQAHSILLLAVQNTDGEWLLRRRTAHPTYGKIGFLHGEPLAQEPTTDTAGAILRRKTGLTATFTPRGSGYIRIFKDNELESFVHFILLHTTKVEGALAEKDQTGENFWGKNPDWSSTDMLPSMPILAEKLAARPDFFFVEESYRLA